MREITYHYLLETHVLLSGSFEATLAELVKPCVTIRALCYLSVNLVGK
jgi:hypothetical protein